MLRLAKSTFGVVLLAFVTWGCSNSDTSASGATNPGGGGGAGAGGGSTSTKMTVDYGDSACGSCVKMQCQAELTACGADPECANYATCLLACPAVDANGVSATCADACPVGTSSESIKAAAALDACRTVGNGAKNCAACNLDSFKPKTPILSQTCGPPTDMASCPKCEDELCCDTQKACLDDPDCVAFETCTKNCDADPTSVGVMNTYDCQQYCIGQAPNGVVTWAPRIACTGFNCLQACMNDPTAPVDACTTCMFTGPCGDLQAAYISTPDGFALAGCILACNDDLNCVGACSMMYPAAEKAYEEYVACVQTSCPC